MHRNGYSSCDAPLGASQNDIQVLFLLEHLVNCDGWQPRGAEVCNGDENIHKSLISDLLAKASGP
jgi:hypothetical protein